MNWKRSFITGVIVVAAVVLLVLAFTGRLQSRLLNADDVKLMILGSLGTHTFNDKEDEGTIRRVVGALNRAKRGKDWKLASKEYIIFHMRSGRCITFGVALLDDDEAVYIGDENNNNYYSKELFGILQGIFKTRKNLHKNTSLPEYEVERLRIHYPHGGLLTLDKRNKVFSLLVSKVKYLTEYLNITIFCPGWPEEVLALYNGKGNIKGRLAENGGIEVFLKNPITISSFAVRTPGGVAMRYDVTHEKFKCRRIIIFKDPKLRAHTMVVFNSINQPERYFIFIPSDTKAGEEGHREKVWGEIGELLDTIGNR